MKIYYDLSGKWRKEDYVGDAVHCITIKGDVSDLEVSELVACLIKPSNKCFRELSVISKGESYV